METTVPTENIVEVIEAMDYTAQLERLEALLNLNADASVLIAGILVFFVVVVLCYFAYKFIRIFI